MNGAGVCDIISCKTPIPCMAAYFFSSSSHETKKGRSCMAAYPSLIFVHLFFAS
jgi:hypothetical protein